jgi:hypothetical protein
VSSDVNVDGIRDGSIQLFVGGFLVTNFTIPAQRVLASARGGAWELDDIDKLLPDAPNSAEH